MSMFDTTEFEAATVPADETLSAGQRLTIRNRSEIAQGRHPATGRPLHPTLKCAACAHLRRYDYHNGRFIKCAKHRLGETHSANSDVRASWPACDLIEVAP